MGATIDLRDWFWTFLQSDLSGSFIFMRILFPCKIPLQTVRKPFHTSLPSFVRLHQFPSVTDANIIIYLFLELFTEITFWKILPFCNEKICLSSRNTFNQVNWKFLPAQSMLNGTHRKWEIFTRESFPGTVQDKKSRLSPPGTCTWTLPQQRSEDTPWSNDISIIQIQYYHKECVLPSRPWLLPSAPLTTPHTHKFSAPCK